MDMVRCNNCGYEGMIIQCEDVCPVCGFDGGLADYNLIIKDYYGKKFFTEGYAKELRIEGLSSIEHIIADCRDSLTEDPYGENACYHLYEIKSCLAELSRRQNKC